MSHIIQFKAEPRAFSFKQETVNPHKFTLSKEVRFENTVAIPNHLLENCRIVVASVESDVKDTAELRALLKKEYGEDAELATFGELTKVSNFFWEEMLWNDGFYVFAFGTTCWTAGNFYLYPTFNSPTAPAMSLDGRHGIPATACFLVLLPATTQNQEKDN